MSHELRRTTGHNTVITCRGQGDVEARGACEFCLGKQSPTPGPLPPLQNRTKNVLHSTRFKVGGAWNDGFNFAVLLVTWSMFWVIDWSDHCLASPTQDPPALPPYQTALKTMEHICIGGSESLKSSVKSLAILFGVWHLILESKLPFPSTNKTAQTKALFNLGHQFLVIARLIGRWRVQETYNHCHSCLWCN